MRKVIGNHVLVKETIPFLGKGVEDVVTAVRAILTNNRTTQKLTLEVGKPFVLEKLIPKDDVPEEVGQTLYDMVRNQPMQEYVIEGEKPPFVHLWDMALMIYSEGFEPGYFLIGDKLTFQKWLEISIPVTKLLFFGIPVKQQTELEADVFILCGVDKANPEEITFSVKATIP